MKKLILVLSVLFATSSFAQKEEFKYLYTSLNYQLYQWYGDKKQEQLAANNVKSVTLFHENYNKKGTLKSKKISSIISFNSKGKPDVYKKYIKNKPESFAYTYDTNNYITSEIRTNDKGEILGKIEKSFYSKIQYKEIVIYKKGGKDIKQRVEYKIDGDFLTQTNYYKSNNQIYQMWKYEYSDDKKLAKTTLYNKKGKVIYTWVHDCKPEGELTTMKSKDTALVCRKVEVNPDGSFIKTVINTQNNEIITQVMTFSKDSVLLNYLGYNKKGILIYKMIANNKYNHNYEYYSYNSKTGKLTNSTQNTYNDADFPITEKYSFFNKKGKEKYLSVNEYSYNEKNLPEKVTHKFKSTKQSADLFEYSY